MSLGRTPRPGDAELAAAGRAAIVMVVCWFFADLFGGMQSPIGLSLTFMLWLATILAGVRAVLAVTIGLHRRNTT